MSKTDFLPTLPLRDIVIFPSMISPLFVGRDKSIKALNQALTREKKHLVDRIFLKKSYSPLKLFISLYIESISQLKKIILKTKRFF